MNRAFLLILLLSSCAKEIESPLPYAVPGPSDLPEKYSGSKFKFYDDQVQAQYKVDPPGLFDNYRVYFPIFLELANDRFASLNDRGQAYLWCFRNFFAVAEQRESALVELNSFASSLIKDWADAEWAKGFAENIGKNHGLVGFDATTVLTQLEKSTTLASRKAEAAYQRVLAVKHENAEILKKAVGLFSEGYPDDSRVTLAQGFLERFTKIQIGEKAPNFTGSTVDGGAISLSDYHGKVTYIVFWGFW